MNKRLKKKKNPFQIFHKELCERESVTLKLSSNVVGDTDDENNFLHDLILTNTQLSRLPKAFAYGSSTNIKVPKTQSHKIGQTGGIFG